MKSRLVKPMGYVSLKYATPRHRTVEFKVIANDPVNTYILNEEGMDDLVSGNPLRVYGGFMYNTFHHQSVELFDMTPKDTWYLVVFNPGDERTKFWYEVLY